MTAQCTGRGSGPAQTAEPTTQSPQCKTHGMEPTAGNPRHGAHGGKPTAWSPRVKPTAWSPRWEIHGMEPTVRREGLGQSSWLFCLRSWQRPPGPWMGPGWGAISVLSWGPPGVHPMCLFLGSCPWVSGHQGVYACWCQGCRGSTRDGTEGPGCDQGGALPAAPSQVSQALVDTSHGITLTHSISLHLLAQSCPPPLSTLRPHPAPPPQLHLLSSRMGRGSKVQGSLVTYTSAWAQLGALQALNQ